MNKIVVLGILKRSNGKHGLQIRAIGKKKGNISRYQFWQHHS